MAPSGEWRRTEGAVASNVLMFWEGQNIVYRPDVSKDDPYDEFQHFQGRVNAVVDVPFSHGTLAVSSKMADAFSENHLAALKEMASYLSDGFKRLDDLGALETRNRELEIEVADRRLREKQSLAIGPVRQAVWDMTGTSDITALLTALRASLGLLEIRFNACGLNLLNDSIDPTSWQVYNLDKEEQWARPVVGARISVILEFWRRSEPIYRRDLAHDDPFDERECLAGTYGDIRSVLDVPFSHGTLALNSSEPDAFGEWQIAGLTELAAVLAEGFRRRDDLQALEHRNQQLEDEIERGERRERLQVARYRVREQVWQMAQASDIDRVLTAIAEALKAMDVVFDFCGVNVLEDGSAGSSLATIYVTRWDGAWSRREDVLDSPPVLDIWRSEKPSYRADLTVDDPYGEAASFKTMRAIVDVPFSLGTLALSSATPNAFSEQDIDVLQNMARLLSEGFQRMADLQSLYGAMAEAKEAATAAEWRAQFVAHVMVCLTLSYRQPQVSRSRRELVSGWRSASSLPDCSEVRSKCGTGHTVEPSFASISL